MCGDAGVFFAADVEVVWPVQVEGGVCFGVRRGCEVEAKVKEVQVSLCEGFAGEVIYVSWGAH